MAKCAKTWFVRISLIIVLQPVNMFFIAHLQFWDEFLGILYDDISSSVSWLTSAKWSRSATAVLFFFKDKDRHLHLGLWLGSVFSLSVSSSEGMDKGSGSLGVARPTHRTQQRSVFTHYSVMLRLCNSIITHALYVISMASSWNKLLITPLLVNHVLHPQGCNNYNLTKPFGKRNKVRRTWCQKCLSHALASSLTDYF